MKRLFCLVLAALLLAGCSAKEEAAEATTLSTESTVPVQTEPVTEATEPPTEVTEEPTEPPEEHYLFTFAGDCTFGSLEEHIRSEYGFTMTVGDDYGFPFRNVAEYFLEDDFSMVNLEGVLGYAGRKSSKRYNFHGDGAFVNILTENSVDAVTLANNHTMDYGAEGYFETRVLLKEAGIPFVETNEEILHVLESGLMIGIYGTVYNEMEGVEEVLEEIRELKEQGADLVIYAPHWGVENTFRPQQDQVDLAHAAIDAGADIVYGTHPHVLQPIEEYNGGVIFYSLGNFSFGGNMYPADYDTAVIQQEVIRAADGTVTLGERTVVPCSISSIENRNNYQPTPYEEGTAEYERVISKLDGSYKGRNLPVR